MANLRRLIDLDKIDPIYFPSTEMDGLDVVRYLNTLPTVDAVPVDQIRVGFRELYLKGQEVVMNVSICGKNNDVRIPFSKDVVEVVRCKDCKKRDTNLCPLYHCVSPMITSMDDDFCSHGERKDNG